MNDLISRQAALREYQSICNEIRCIDCPFCLYLKDTPDGCKIENFINAMPSAREWIPVSERLPDIGAEVLVCYDFKGMRSVDIANFYGDGRFYGFDYEFLTADGRKYRKAVAWMPLPAPFKGGEMG